MPNVNIHTHIDNVDEEGSAESPTVLSQHVDWDFVPREATHNSKGQGHRRINVAPLEKKTNINNS